MQEEFLSAERREGFIQMKQRAGAITHKFSSSPAMTKRSFPFSLLTLVFILLFLNYYFVFQVYSSPYVTGYYPLTYNLLGQTQWFSGELSDLTSDNGVHMTFRSYGSSYATGNEAMFAYGEDTASTPRYRIWDGANWGTEVSASETASTIQWLILESNPNRNEKILGTLASTGAIHVQVWNGSSWSSVQPLGSGVGTTNDAYRSFDIAYEQASGRAIVVFVPSSTAVDPQYVIWNGSSWTAPATIDISTTGAVYWVKLASRPLSNQIALMTLDANADIAGIIWNGSTWHNTKTLTTSASTALRECFAVEYEQQSGYAMFLWGELRTDLYYWRWDGSAWIGTAATLLDIPSQGGVSNWISLKADSNSDRLMIGVQDAGADLNTREWSGTAWDTATEHPEHDSTVESVLSRSFDIEYETFPGHEGHAMLVWGDAYYASWKHWTPATGSSGWSSRTILAGSDDTAVTQLRRNSDGRIFAALLDDPASGSDDLVEYRWDGSTWSSRLVVEDTPTRAAQPMMEPFMIAPDTHPTPIEYITEVEFTGSSNTYDWTELVWTINSAWTSENVAVTIQLYNYTLGDYPTNGNGYISYTSSSIPNTDETKSQTITTSPTHFRDTLGNWKIKVKGVKTTSTQFDFKADLVKLEVTHLDTTPPEWSNAETNSTIAGQPTLFHVKWTDDFELSGFIFGTNNTGTWINDTWAPMGGSTNWSNVTKILSSTALVVQWRVWANDTSNNWNDTGILEFTLLHLPVASFTYTPSTAYTGETVTFDASASYDPDGTITSYFWNFGDGTNSTGTVTTHSYADDGVYTIPLTVTDNDGLTDTESQTIIILNRLPTASFTESNTSVPTGTTIYFNASSSFDPDGSIVSYFWDFGDGINGTGVTIEHTYTDNGTYTVALTITDDDGATANATATKTISNRPPTASFTESATTVYTEENIHFDASGSIDPDGSIVSYFWDFGDGTNATGLTVDHFYAEDGTYTVTLTVTDNDGATATAVATKTVLNRVPVAFFTESATAVFTNEIITFDASGSYDPDGSIVSYFWDFGDGTNSTGLTVTHVYPDNGNYLVTLTVTDDDSSTDSTSATKTVLNRVPVASFAESATTVLTNEVIYFNASASYDLDGTILSYFWDFGDGINATGMTVSHAYTDDGTYNVTLTVTDNDGSTSTANAVKTVLNRGPVASFTETATSVLTNEAIYFNASQSYDPDGSIVSYFWDFGDGTNATGMAVSHAYADNGIYTVILTIADDDGAEASTDAAKTISNRSPVASFTETAETDYTGTAITFNASASYDPDGSIVTYFWDFGDETNATGVVVSHAYADNGTFVVTLTITDDDGATSTATSTKTALNRSPVASFTESSETVYKGEVITFNASSSYDPDGTITSYFWDFGDGTNATGSIASHAYADDGVYTVILTVTDNDNATGVQTATKNVLNRTPVVSFTESATTVFTSEIIYFNASASYDPDGVIVSYFWDFGDGTNTTGATTSHAYTNEGVYTVVLIVTDDDGATGNATATKTILNRAPVALFTESTTTALTDVVISFNASDSYDTDGTLVSYFWDFGDGTNGTGVTVDHAYLDDGVYTVTLTVTDDDGATSTVTATKTIQNRPPTALFTESATTVYTGEIIYFNASSSYDPDGVILSYFWDFGDGTNATGILANHTYVDNGTYTVDLTVTDDDGATSTASSTKTVLNTSPVASFTESSTTAYKGEVIRFNASVSYDPDGSVVSYFWDFGDGTNASGVIVDHAYTNVGTYTVTLTVTDNDGATASTTAVKTVLSRPPVASFIESATTVYTDDVINFNASISYDPDGVIVSHFWIFGDGTNATGVIVSHAYADNGTYVVTLAVTDNDGVTATATATKTVLNKSPVASFSESATNVYTYEPITFNATSSYDPDGSIVNYTWNFGDGNVTTLTSPIVTHTYVDDGTYTVTLTVTDNDGATATSTATKNVLNRVPVASFTESASVVPTGEAIMFNASASYDPDGSIVGYFWTFGDGTNAPGVVVTHAYADNGTYVVTLTVTDNDGATASNTATKTILNRPPVASFTESATTVYTGEVIYFNASASYDPDGSIVSFFWDFGDGTNATGIIVNHAYADNGVYTVALTVTDNDGAVAAVSAIKTIGNRPPIASFTESATTVFTNEIIYFNASVSYDLDGSIVSYFWNFGDGANATGITVNHAYADNNIYTVTLTVTDNDGATGTATATKTVVNRPPVASFTENATTILTGVAIRFNASGSYDPDGTIVSYFWDFGDGANATGIVVDHAYLGNGVYTVTLNVTDNDGEIATSSATKTVLNRSPVASFSESATTVYTGDSITFNASSSYDPDGTIISYWWDFDDGTNATGMMVNHAYADNGTYTVTLVVTDDDGAANSVTATKTVLNRSPVASFSESAQTVYTGENVTFNAAQSYDPDGTIVEYFWDFGDGTNATEIAVQHSYVDDGNYTVTLTVTDDDQVSTSTSSIKTVVNRPPVASFTESAATVYTGVTISFDASGSYDPDGNVIEYFWDFGDGTNGAGVTMGHSYADDGNYTVTLTITDNDGATSTVTSTKTILNRSPVAEITQSATVVYTNEAIHFSASGSTDPDGIILVYFWNFGDGTNATIKEVDHAYADNGTYSVILTVTDDDGATGTATSTTRVLNSPPVASFTESAQTVYTNEIIAFNASASYDLDGSIVSIFWDFGDGTNGTGATVQHAYNSSGAYTVTLTVTDNDGATSTTSAQKTVAVTPPVAIFTESAETVLTSEIIYFNASSSYDPDGTIVTYYWNFGDGSNATGVTTQHVYADDGNYTVTLTVTDDDGAADSATATKIVLNSPPVASFTESAQTALTGQTIDFNAFSSYDLDGTIVSYFWDFGDGTNANGVTASHAYVDDGNYTATLTVTDDDGVTATTSATKIISNRPPVAFFTESATTAFTGEAITFNASGSYDPDGSIVSYFWDFGDGTNTTGIIVSHAYVDDGNYTATLTVTDDDGLTTSTSATKTVLNSPPVAFFTESAENVIVGQTIYFDASASYDSDGVIVSYFWDFGDGTNATGVTVEHAYADDGIYTVNLTVTDDDGENGTATAEKNVGNTPPVASFTESAQTAYTGETIYFDASASYDPDGTIVSHSWNFGDGTTTAGVTVNHTYIEDGYYTVTLTVTDDDDATATANSSKTVLNRLPLAVFTESAESVLTGEVISFNASGSYDPDGSIVSYFWDFGDGVNATGVTVQHAYAQNGTYTVTLTVTDDDGENSTATSTKYVGNSPPVASFTESAATVYTGVTISFDAGGSYDPDGTIVTYFWDFGDGANATGMTVGHSFVDNRNYTVTLTVTDDYEATSSVSAVKTVLNRAPTAEFIQSRTKVNTGELINFDASNSYDADGTIISYFWDFGDGTNSPGVIVDHAYSDNGNYTITLTITDDDGATGTATGTAQVLNRSPVASFTESAETFFTNEIITFNASNSYDSDGLIVSYFWDFGDGANSSGMVVTHSYVDDGNYTVTLTITDGDGATGTATSTKSVLNRAPIASFTESTETAYTDEAFAFNASGSYDVDGSVVSYLWDFGDGTNATGITVQHAYADNGNYTVTLTVTDNDGANSSVSASKTVLNRSPIASFTESTGTALTSESITFDASGSYDVDGSVVSYLWDFGDGTNTTGVVVNHAYSDNGNYTVTLSVVDDDGATSSTSSTKTILNRSPTAVFTESAETVYVGQIIYFNASNSYDVDGYVISYLWDFGDGTNSTGMIVERAYEINGTYTVTLTVTDDDDAANSASSTKIILWNEPPVPVLTESAETVFTGETISFNASDSYDPDGVIVGYFWDFGDGSNVTSVAVQHSYPIEGNYTVTLKVTDDKGATSSTSVTKTVLNRSPIASFTESAGTVLTNETIYFNASSSYDPDGSIVSYFWDFGDGNNATGVTVSHAYVDKGSYTVTLTVSDNDGETSSISSTKTVLNRSPTASFVYSPSSPIAGETVTFDASSSYDPDGYISNYTWNFGDGNMTTVANPTITHIYAAEGKYTVTLTVEDNDAANDSAEATVDIRNYPTAAFTFSPVSPGQGLPVTFDASSSKPNGGVIVNYTWNFGDGNITTVTLSVVTHVYQVAGNYTVTLTVIDSEELSDSHSETVEVGVPPVAAFTFSPVAPFAGESITFDASSSYDPDGYISNYTWNFGDGNMTTVANPTITHVYTTGATYTVELTVMDNKGFTGTQIQSISVKDYPTAEFTWSPSYPLVNEITTFDASASSPNGGVITHYFWDFGDGTPSVNVTDPITTHTYAAIGNYTVTLTVTDSEGLSDTISHTLSLRDHPQASFTYSPELPTANVTVVTFDASSSTPNHGTITNYTWNFGDGNITTATTPFITHIYVTAGNYTAILTVADNEGLTDSTSKTVSVGQAWPIAYFTYYPDYPAKGEIVIFDASQSYDPDGYISNYIWNFGDGNITVVTAPIIQHAYASVGSYTVTLNVTDNHSLTEMFSQTLSVRGYPTADFTWLPMEPEVNTPATFDASTSTPDGGVIVSYEWNFGDGNVTTTSDITVTHYYETFGAYTVTLRVTDSEGLWDTESKTLKVIAPPTPNFTWSPTIPLENQTVTFNASASVPNGGMIAFYLWDFGDGSLPRLEAYRPTTTHIYEAFGNYTVKLTAIDTENLNASISKVITIGANPTANFTWSPEYPQAYEIIVFDASMSNPRGGNIISYKWDFGDGNVTTVMDPVISHYYAMSGDYLVILNVTDNEGFWGNQSKTISVAVSVPPQAEFTWSPTAPYFNETVTFDASESTPNGGVIVSYEWNFGDGAVLTTSDSITDHSYSLDGNFTVTLNVTDSQGLWRSTSKTISVLPPSGPKAEFTWYPLSPVANRTVSFDASNSQPGWDGTHHPPIVSYTWDFGDGNMTTVTTPNIEHTYTQAGNYTVTLIVVDSLNQPGGVSYVIEVLELMYCDVNGDGFVDVKDLLMAAFAYGSRPGDPNWEPRADINGDDFIDIKDILIIALHYGEGS